MKPMKKRPGHRRVKIKSLHRGRGGARVGAGRKKGVNKKAEALQRRIEMMGGKMPHMLLLDWAQSGMIGVRNKAGEEKMVPLTMEMRVDVTKAAAPYFAPRLGATYIKGELNGNVNFQAIETTRKQLEEYSAAELTSFVLEAIRSSGATPRQLEGPGGGA